jgi:hypothetical protein
LPALIALLSTRCGQRMAKQKVEKQQAIEFAAKTG